MIKSSPVSLSQTDWAEEAEQDTSSLEAEAVPQSFSRQKLHEDSRLGAVALVTGPVRLLVDIFAITVVAGPLLHVAPVPLLIIFLGTMALFRLYAPPDSIHRSSILLDIPRLASACGVAALLLLVTFPDGQEPDFRYAVVVAAYTFVVLAMFRGLLCLTASRLRRVGFGIRPTLIVGGGRTASLLVDKIGRHPELGLCVVGMVSGAVDTQDASTDCSCDILGSSPQDLPRIIAQHGIREMILVPDEDAPEFVTECFLAVDGYSVDAVMVPPVKDFLLSPSSIEHIEGIPLIPLGCLSYAPRYMPGKRLVDIFGALCALLVISPLFLVTALFIKIEDRGAVFFSQRRAGHRGRYFRMWKFRSMCVDAEARLAELEEQNEGDGLLFKIREDPRITHVGRFIRKSSIDELPQLWNVLKGDMSLVGPRALPVEVEHFGDLAIKRLNVRPGVTGLWQVTGRSNLTYEEMVKLDLAYIQNWSLWLDMKLILQTIPVLLNSEGAY